MAYVLSTLGFHGPTVHFGCYSTLGYFLFGELERLTTMIVYSCQGLLAFTVQCICTLNHGFYQIFSFYPNSVVGIVEVALERKRISGCRLSSPKITTLGAWNKSRENGMHLQAMDKATLAKKEKIDKNFGRIFHEVISNIVIIQRCLVVVLLGNRFLSV